jgi:purine nucleosidase
VEGNMRPRFPIVMLLLSGVAAVGCSHERALSNSISAKVPIPAILTTDVGAEMDDQWTVAHLLLSPEVDLKAIVTTHAQIAGLSSQSSARKADDVLMRVLPDAKSKWPRVEAGSTLPLEGAKNPRESIGVDLLLSISREFSPSKRLTVFVTGAATDVASAILKDPTISNRIIIVAMAFNDWPSGGDVFNVGNDPAAWTPMFQLLLAVLLLLGRT